jgi:hypothetical protein
MRYDEQLRDARNAALMPSTRVRAAYDAIFICCQQPGVAGRLSTDDVALVNRLRTWVLQVAPLPPLPMSPDEAIALAHARNPGACAHVVRQNMVSSTCPVIADDPQPTDCVYAWDWEAFLRGAR